MAFNNIPVDYDEYSEGWIHRWRIEILMINKVATLLNNWNGD